MHVRGGAPGAWQHRSHVRGYELEQANGRRGAADILSFATGFGLGIVSLTAPEWSLIAEHGVRSNDCA
jgi:hypothetical protein